MQITPFHKPNILAFVEGVMEKMFINNNFSYITLIPVQNGESWSADRLADQISSKFFVRNVNPDHIVVWLDRESHNRQCSEIRQKIVAALVARGALASIHVCVADLMTENIILADEEAMRDWLNDPEYIYCYEGTNGKAELKKLLGQKGQTYRETVHGLKLLKKIRLSRAAEKSQSAADFVENFIIDCWWVKGPTNP